MRHDLLRIGKTARVVIATKKSISQINPKVNTKKDLIIRAKLAKKEPPVLPRGVVLDLQMRRLGRPATTSGQQCAETRRWPRGFQGPVIPTLTVASKAAPTCSEKNLKQNSGRPQRRRCCPHN